MPLAAALGLAGDRFAHDGLSLPAVDEQRVVLVGVRSLDPAERALIRERGLRAITMTEIDRIGIEAAMREAIDRVSGPGFVHVSLDLDALDPEVAPGVGTPVKGGLTYREAHLACEDLAEAGLVGSLELVEVNPILDRENGSASIAVELAASALGQSIL
jgi:arginase